MDKSEQYIKMCEKAEEIQKLWNPIDGDFCWHGNEGAEYLGSYEFPATTAVVHIATGNSKDYWYNWLWLPRQDQLQEMIGDYNECLDRLTGYSDMGIDRELEYYHQFTSFDQLWLAFVMADKEDKYWCWVEGDWVPHKVGVGEDLF